jgi:hypothetical protein
MRRWVLLTWPLWLYLSIAAGVWVGLMVQQRWTITTAEALWVAAWWPLWVALWSAPS